mgnify:CR=1 FL=1
MESFKIKDYSLLRNYLLALYILTNSTFISAQVLYIDRENGQDTIPRKVGSVIGLSFASDKQKNDFVEFSSNAEIDFFLKKNHLFILFGHVDMAFNGKNVIENNGFAMARLRDNDTRKIYPEAFVQYQWNGVLGMQSRVLGGANARIKLFENEDLDGYSSLGLFYEDEIWNTETGSYAFDTLANTITVHRQLIRLNTNVKIAVELSEKIDFAISQYLQLPMNESFININKPRWFMNADLFFEFNKNFSFNVHYDHTLDNYRALPIDRYYYNLNLGIQLSL